MPIFLWGACIFLGQYYASKAGRAPMPTVPRHESINRAHHANMDSAE